MTNKTWRQRWLASLTRLVHGDGRRAAGRRRVVFRLEELESRLVPSATVQFSTGAETVNASAGTFSVPVTLTGAPTPVVTTFASGFNNPTGLAFDAAGNLYVANDFVNTVSKVTPAGVVSPFASGFDDPAGLAFDAAGNLYVANSNANTVSEVTPGGVVSPFASGFDEPQGLAFDAAGNLYVANEGDNTVSKVTPGGVVSPFASGFGIPIALAFDAAGNLYVSNDIFGTVSKVSPAGVVSPFASGFHAPDALAFDAVGNLYVSNVNDNTVSKVTPAGVVSPFASGFDGPEALAFDAAGNLYVTNFADNTVSEVSTTVTVPFTLGGTAVSGTDYAGVTSSPLVFPTGQTTEDITGTLPPDPGTIRTLTFALGAPTDAALGSPDVNILTIDDSNPAPTLTSISPASAAVGTPDVIVTLTGTNFVSNSTADFNGAPLATNFISATQLTALIPGSDLATAGADAILVATPGAGGGFSAPQTFTVNNPAPTLTSISPTSATLGDPATTITLTGTGFISGATTADFNGTALATTFVSANQLTAVVPASDLTTPGQAPITVVTAGPGGGTSAAQIITFNNPAPILTSISATSATAGGPDTTITLTGTGFVSDLVVTGDSFADFNGKPLATTFVSATQLTAVIPAADLATAGGDMITVVTNGPGGGVSAPQTFAVNLPAPTLTSLSATSATAGDNATTIALTGTNFVSGSTTADFNGAPIATTFVSANQLTAVIPASDLAAAGVDSITVVNVGPGGGTSAAQTFTVNAAATPPTALTPNQLFLSHVYLDLLGHAIDPSGLATWGAMLDAGVSRTNVVLAIENDPGHEFLHVEVNDAFMQYLKRDADAGGLASFTNFLAGGGTVEQMDALIASSPEYQTDAASRGGFNNAFYEDTLGRPLGAPTDPPASPVLTSDQIAAVFTSPEYYQHLASDYYLRFLDRSFGPADATRAGTPDGLQIAEIMGDPGNEYFNKTAP